ncbi:MAG TPA: sigma-E factor negative regulatory protein [Piscinibacter sp.]|mgnify:FL=1|nr:sigma-E factor negative regulatory protein [Piscinibacter sp.]HOY35704.1 sigma-E factor negative regulatory protein [Piscinibacter sp.]HPG77609.1 sigma-E factor negative regulatory protein [Piscinibacter sp.]HPM66386.1 sigma-E factor negative regulatory protein [Piscinibacter sp.]
MSSEQSVGSNGAEEFSALVDGELGPDGLVRACASWRSDARSRQTWHAYHLIGDVLRSDDLASHPDRDVDFLNRLRERLADEPVVLAPPAVPAVPAIAGRRALRHWRAGAAVAAGFVAVAGVLVVMRSPVPQAAPELARAPVVSPVVPVAADAGVEQAAYVTDGRVMRDARLDRYLAAHQQFAGASALGVPSAFLRSATTDASKR